MYIATTICLLVSTIAPTLSQTTLNDGSNASQPQQVETTPQAPGEQQPSLLERVRPGDSQSLQEKHEDGNILEPSAPVIGEPKIITSPAAKEQASEQANKVQSNTPAKTEEIKQHMDTPKPVVDEGGNVIKAKRPTVALVLGGGGARGAAHLGVLEVFEQAGIPIDYIVGNSAGSIVGGLYSAGVPLSELKQMFFDKSLRKAYLPGAVPPAFLVGPFFKLTHIFSKEKHYAGIFSGKKFEKFLESKLPNKDFSFEQLDKLKFSAVAVDLVDGKAYALNSGRMAPAIRASATITPLLQPKELDGRVLMDGGVRANLPASQARDTKADVVIAVVVDEPIKPAPKKNFHSIRGVVDRLANIILAVMTEHQLKYADIVINPDVSGINTLTKRSSDAVKSYDAGRRAAIKALPDIQKRLQLPANSQNAQLPQDQAQKREAARENATIH